MECLDKRTLAALGSGLIVEPELSEARRHLASCASCREAVDSEAEETKDLRPRTSQRLAPSGPQALNKLGPYLLLEQLGQGGMG